MKTTKVQASDWSITQADSLNHHSSSIIDKGNHMDVNIILNHANQRNFKNNAKRERISAWKFSPCCSWMSPVLQGFILGILILGLVLAVFVTLWLTFDRKTTISTVAITKTSTVMNNNITTSTILTAGTTTTISTTVTTSTATISNICTGGSTYTTQFLSLSLTSTLLWTEYVFNYTAPNITSAKLTFALQNDPDFWYLDDVSVKNSSGNQLLSNGNFETGDLTGWIYCNPNSSNFSGSVGSFNPHNGSYSYEDGSVGASDYLSQIVAVIPNSIYSVKFWLSSGSNSSSYAHVTISS